MSKIFVLFVALLGVSFAQELVDVSTIAKPLVRDAARQFWTAIDGGVDTKITNRMASASGGLSDLQYPQATGVVQVIAEPNGGRSRTVRFISTKKPIRGIVAGRITLPNGETFGLQPFDLDRCCGSTMISMDLWLRDFSPHWPYGITRFDVYNVVDGHVSRASAYVGVSTRETAPEPNIGNIGLIYVDGGKQALVSPGPFKSKELAIVVGFAPAEQFSLTPFGNLVITVPAVITATGNITVTICEAGLCGTRIFYYNPFPTPPPFPGPPPGRG